MNFDAQSEHEYTGDNFFTLGFIALGEDKHTSECIVETKFFQAETMKGVNARQAEERAAARKRKSESAAPEKVAKRTKKEKTVKDSHATEPLPAAGSIPSGKMISPVKLVNLIRKMLSVLLLLLEVPKMMKDLKMEKCLKMNLKKMRVMNSFMNNLMPIRISLTRRMMK